MAIAKTEIAKSFGNDTIEVDAARLRLIDALLSIASEDRRDVEILKWAALQRMELDGREWGSRWMTSPLPSNARLKWPSPGRAFQSLISENA